MGLFDAIGDFVGGIGDAVGDVVGGVVDGVSSAVGGVFDGFRSVGSGIFNFFEETLVGDGLIQGIADLGTGLFGGITNPVRGVVEGALDIGGGIVDGAVSLGTGIVNGVDSFLGISALFDGDDSNGDGGAPAAPEVDTLPPEALISDELFFLLLENALSGSSPGSNLDIGGTPNGPVDYDGFYPSYDAPDGPTSLDSGTVPRFDPFANYIVSQPLRI